MNILTLQDRGTPGILANAIQDGLTGAGYLVTPITLNYNDINPCVGCFRCWTHTPGLCAQTGDPCNRIAQLEMRSDALVLVSRIAFGGFSSDIKAFLDRSIPNVLPLFEVYQGEMHHKPRYARFPIWIGVGYGDARQEERQTFERLIERNAINMRPLRHRAIFAEPNGAYGETIHRILAALEDTK